MLVYRDEKDIEEKRRDERYNSHEVTGPAVQVGPPEVRHAEHRDPRGEHGRPEGAEPLLVPPGPHVVQGDAHDDQYSHADRELHANPLDL